jgi:8-oxo-dGTP pyrophosphatase MutT (NUDIX family)
MLKPNKKATRVVVALISRIGSAGEGEYLLVSSRKDFGKNTGAYYPPGGHVEEGESELAALKRELYEELRMKIISAEKITEIPGDEKGLIAGIYKCKTESENFRVNREELADAGYFSKKAMGKMLLWPATAKLFAESIFGRHAAMTLNKRRKKKKEMTATSRKKR